MKKWLLFGLAVAAALPRQAHAQRPAAPTTSVVLPPSGGGGTAVNYCAEPVSGFLARYDRFRDDAGTAGLVTVSNGQLYDAPNRPASP
ncbi:hypothetical protein [Hymenobacter armeniacus]|uniref:Uncharacterized protein n=1 Tax=Hymenobacter armeniacus TaxID=2771358 RepID=A0ABR8JPK7_9BACT|nr:hypothetical protein [Hymenobacter armeniacus]MBD2720535.1 hypothetical protein [Hymenobacter armeniacus]